MKTWALNQLSQITAWIGLAVIAMAFLAPRDWIAIIGVLLVVVDEAWLRKTSMSLRAKLEESLK